LHSGWWNGESAEISIKTNMSHKTALPFRPVTLCAHVVLMHGSEPLWSLQHGSCSSSGGSEEDCARELQMAYLSALAAMYQVRVKHTYTDQSSPRLLLPRTLPVCWFMED
jgi:hypothetical protein